MDDPANAIHVSILARVELVSALTRSFRRGNLTQQEFDGAHDESRVDFENQYLNIEVTGAIVEEAVDLSYRHGLRAYDAVQLATALEVRRILQNEPVPLNPMMITADQALIVAAPLEQLAVDNPNDH